MKFALLNPDADGLALASALVRDGGHELTAYFSIDAGAVATLESLAPEARRIDEWEGVLAGSAQAVVVGTAGTPAPTAEQHGLDHQGFEQLRRLVLENVPLVFVHPFGLQPLEYHELDMNRQATKTAIVAYEPMREHPAIQQLSTAGEGGIGRIEQIVVERQAKARTRAASLRHFVRDVGMAKRLTGPCDKVSALGKFGDDPNSVAPTSGAPAVNGRSPYDVPPMKGDGGHLGVQITTTDGVLIRWSIGPIVDLAGAKMTLVGTAGSAVVTMPEHEPWTLQTRHGDDVATETFADAGTAEAAERIAAAIESSDDRLWREALADLELVEAVERSVRRGRTVELFHEEASEQGTFHGVMAAGGCLLMMLAIGLAIVATVFGKFRFWLANFWPYALLLVLSMFLLMQLFKFVFPTAKKDD
jgi:myo-inositol 2-dehydrogenase/D-chiro-inositol 1-dehydrogenase